MGEKIVAAVCAYNEEGWIASVLKPLLEAKRSGLLDDILVVDDGSEDMTGQIAEAFRVNVIRHEKNLGKARAFMSAVDYCNKAGADILFLSDADMLNLTEDKIGGFLAKVRGNPDVWMMRAPYFQGGKTCAAQLSGFRALRLSRLADHMSSDKWREVTGLGGFSLEIALESCIPETHKGEDDSLGLKSRPAGAGASGLEKIASQAKAAGRLTGIAVEGYYSGGKR